MLQLENFGHMTAPTILFEPRHKNLLMRNYDVITFISKYPYFEKGIFENCNHVY